MAYAHEIYISCLRLLVVVSTYIDQLFRDDIKLYKSLFHFFKAMFAWYWTEFKTRMLIDQS